MYFAVEKASISSRNTGYKASARPKLCESVPDDVYGRATPSLPKFRRKLKTHLFWQSYSDIIL